MPAIVRSLSFSRRRGGARNSKCDLTEGIDDKMKKTPGKQTGTSNRTPSPSTSTSASVDAEVTCVTGACESEPPLFGMLGKRHKSAMSMTWGKLYQTVVQDSCTTGCNLLPPLLAPSDCAQAHIIAHTRMPLESKRSSHPSTLTSLHCTATLQGNAI